MQTDYATAAASGGPDAADFNAQKVDKETLMNLFRNKKPFLMGDSEEERDKKASAKVAKYYAVRAKMFTEGYPTDHDSIMAMLEKLYG
jgi:phosphoribosylamine-glycine ligase